MSRTQDVCPRRDRNIGDGALLADQVLGLSALKVFIEGAIKPPCLVCVPFPGVVLREVGEVVT